MNQVDPITLEVVRGYLVSTVYQMRATLMRTAYAPILYESLDFSCGLLNTKGELVAMSEDFVGHVFAMSLGLEAVVDKFGDGISPGDVYAVNDPYTGGTHLNDIAFYLPFASAGRILMHIAVRAHHADVGGATLGSFSGQDTEIYQEGVRIVPVRLIEDGVLNQALWDVMFANMRMQDEREGDALAMLDTARVAEMRLAELSAKYGPDTLEECVSMLLNNSEKAMRGRIQQLPDGEYHYEHYMDNSGLSPEPLPIKLNMTVDGDAMHFDFTGTSPQVAGPMNCGVPVTCGGVFVIIKSWLDPKTPVNGGTFRPISFVIPNRSCLAAELPAAVGGCWEVFRQVQTSVIGAFSQMMPDQLGGENLGTSNHTYIGGFDPARGRHYILYEYLNGGYPATTETDGASGTSLYDLGDTPQVFPAESVEQRLPLLIESLEVSTDGEGAGFRRSGLGSSRRIKVLSDGSQLNVMADRAVIPPWGPAGASPGMRNSFTVIRDGRTIEPSPIRGKVKAFPLQYGDVVLIQATAGGGVGDPLEREAERVRRDVLEGYTTPQRARDVYGVVLGDAGEIDVNRTRKARSELVGQRLYLQLKAGAEDEYDDRGCRLCKLSPAAADKIGVGDGDLVELVNRTTAPLRAWVRVTDEAPEDAVEIGPVGHRILGADTGGPIWIRPLRVEP